MLDKYRLKKTYYCHPLDQIFFERELDRLLAEGLVEEVSKVTNSNYTIELLRENYHEVEERLECCQIS